jgi:hypothetical protein
LLKGKGGSEPGPLAVGCKIIPSGVGYGADDAETNSQNANLLRASFLGSLSFISMLSGSPLFDCCDKIARDRR